MIVKKKNIRKGLRYRKKKKKKTVFFARELKKSPHVVNWFRFLVLKHTVLLRFSDCFKIWNMTLKKILLIPDDIHFRKLKCCYVVAGPQAL